MARTIKLEFNKRCLRGFSGNQLKMIACFLMLCDSIGYMLIENGVLYGLYPEYWTMALATEQGMRWYAFAKVLRFFGRMAFPIFAYLISEGFIHTSSPRWYGIRMLICALISEVPFDLATRHMVWDPSYQNVCFTYVIAIFTMYLIKKARKLPLAVRILIMGAGAAAAFLARSDYGALGVVFICMMYMLRNDRTARLVTGALLSAAESLGYYCISAFSFILIRFYNGKRGAVPMKYLFYLIYPAHMLLFYALVYFANR